MDILYSEGDGLKVAAIEEFDFQTATSILRRVRAGAEHCPLEIDLSCASGIENASIGVLIELVLSRGRDAKKISLVNPSPTLLNSLHAFRIEPFFDIKQVRKSA